MGPTPWMEKGCLHLAVCFKLGKKSIGSITPFFWILKFKFKISVFSGPPKCLIKDQPPFKLEKFRRFWTNTVVKNLHYFEDGPIFYWFHIWFINFPNVESLGYFHYFLDHTLYFWKITFNFIIKLDI